MVSISTSTGTAYTIPANADIRYVKNIGITTIPIPYSDSPILLDYGGASIDIDLVFTTITESDVSFLINNFSSASGLSYTLDLSAEWNMSFSGYIKSLSIRQRAGEGKKWDVEIIFAIGSIA